MDSVATDSRTPDEMFLVSGVGSYALLLSLLARDLLALDRLVRALGVSPALPLKLAARCAAVARLARDQGPLLRSALAHRRPRVRFRLSAFEATQLPDLPLSRQRLRALLELGPVSLAEGASADLRAADEALVRVEDDLRAVLGRASQGGGPAVALDEIVPVSSLAALAEESLRENHPQALDPGHGADECTFVLIHQVVELWFLIATRSLEEAIAALQGRPPALAEAARLVDGVSGVLRWVSDAIHLPETIGVGDYLLFRHQLAGSGMESPNFRKLQMLLQVPGEACLHAFRKGNLMTAEMEALSEGVSLDAAFRSAVIALGVVGPEDALPEQARKLAALFVPVGAADYRLDAVDLMRAMLRLSQQYKLWQTHHALMVETMIGTRPVLSVGDRTADDLPDGMGGLPYLRRVLNSALLFPVLGAAVNRAQPGGYRG
jgi:tryptophan 2,3-dioxygenase